MYNQPMVKQLLRAQLLVVVILAVCYGIGYWSITTDQKNEQILAQKTQKAPPGMAYIRYCDGGLSNQLGDANDHSCFAERPGDFAKFALAVYAAIAALLFPIVFIAYNKIRAKVKD